MTRLVAVVGSSPGIGKSTVCRQLVRRLRESGLHVDHFAEEHIVTRRAFGAVASAFKETGMVEPSALLAGTAAFVADAQREGWDVVIADALVPYVPSLRAWGHSEAELEQFLRGLEEILRPLDPIFCFLDGDPANALPRAIEREGPGWEEWFVSKLSVYTPVRDLPSAIAYLAGERAVFRRLLEGTAWRLHVVPEAHRLEPDEISATVSAMIDGFGLIRSIG